MATVKDVLAKWGTKLHATILRVSKGKVLGSGYGMPMLILETTGAKSGEPRSTVLTTPLVDGELVFLVASYGGDDRNPAWFHNVVAHPDVQITMQDEVRPMRATVLEGEERDRRWAALAAAHDNYARYQAKTDRLIPVVQLSPR